MRSSGSSFGIGIGFRYVTRDGVLIRFARGRVRLPDGPNRWDWAGNIGSWIDGDRHASFSLLVLIQFSVRSIVPVPRCPPAPRLRVLRQASSRAQVIECWNVSRFVDEGERRHVQSSLIKRTAWLLFASGFWPAQPPLHTRFAAAAGQKGSNAGTAYRFQAARSFALRR
jgi:hypothetical protein